MSLKTLQLAADLRERLTYDSCTLPLLRCRDLFDDYAKREWSCHWHDEFEFMLVEKGRLCCTVYEGLGRPSSFELTAGDALFINSGVLHSIKALEKGAESLGAAFPPSFFASPLLQSLSRKMLQPVSDSGRLCLVASAKEGDAWKSALRELHSVDEGELCYELKYVECICRLWRMLIQQLTDFSAPMDQLAEKRMKQMLSYIHEHFHEPITPDDLARHAGISRTECFKCFRSVIQKTPVAYLTEYRLSIAAMLLNCSSKNITEIAGSCGFADTSYFAKLFRRAYGVTPMQFRKQNHLNND